MPEAVSLAGEVTVSFTGAAAVSFTVAAAGVAAGVAAGITNGVASSILFTLPSFAAGFLVFMPCTIVFSTAGCLNEGVAVPVLNV